MKPHTSHIAAALLIAWIIFVISRQELPIYMGILGIGKYDITADKCNQGSILGSVTGGRVGVTVGGATTPNYPGTVSVGYVGGQPGSSGPFAGGRVGVPL